MIEPLSGLLWVLLLFGLPVAGFYASRKDRWSGAQQLVDEQWVQDGADEDREAQRRAELNDYWQRDELPEDDETMV